MAFSGAEAEPVKTRIARGRQERRHVGREQLGALTKRPRGFDPVAEVLAAGAGRVRALLPLKYSRMSASPFAFFRGSVSLMAADFALSERTKLEVQLCGDAHLWNLGAFEAPDGRLVFDINDFDETVRGPWEWDVKRMAVSVVLAGLESGHKGAECREAAEAFTAAYCRAIRLAGEQPFLVAARHQVQRERRSPAVQSAFEQAERSNPLDLLQKLTERTGRSSRFRTVKGVLWRPENAEREGVLRGLARYRKSLEPAALRLFDRFRPVDAAFKVVGIGSVGMRSYVVLLEGNGAEDPLFLQMKQEVRSAYAPLLEGARSRRNEGERVVEGQRAIQPQSDMLLGWSRIDGRDYLVRQLNDRKGGIDLKHLRGAGLASLAEIGGELLARGHARSGDALTVTSYLGDGEKAVMALSGYGMQYAERVRQDFGEFQEAVKAGRVPVAKEGL